MLSKLDLFYLFPEEYVCFTMFMSMFVFKTRGGDNWGIHFTNTGLKRDSIHRPSVFNRGDGKSEKAGKSVKTYKRT